MDVLVGSGVGDRLPSRERREAGAAFGDQNRTVGVHAFHDGHVAVVERVNADGSVLISEGGTGFATFPAWETISNAGAYQYVHY